MIKYVAYYVPEGMEKENRVSNPAGVNVMDYMKDVYASCGEVEILAPCRTQNKKGRYKKKEFALNERIKYKAPATFGYRTIFGKVLSNIKTKLWLFNHLIFKTKKTDTVIVYHSPFIMGVVKIAKRLKRFTLIQEIREIYGDIWKSGNKLKKKEFKYFSIADKYIFATTEIEEMINANAKPYLISPGVYRYEKELAEKYDDGKIHLVYAGNLNKSKYGAYISLRIASLLPPQYVTHILGHGVGQQQFEFEQEYERVKETNPQIIYEGRKSGNELNALLQKCHLGLAVQVLGNKYDDSSFPSKVLVYMKNGLKVYCPNMPSVKNSPVGKYVAFYDGGTYDGQDYVKIASGIMELDFDENISYKEIFHQLDLELKQGFNALIK